MSQHGFSSTRRGTLGGLVIAVVLAGCGSPSDLDPRGPPAADAGHSRGAASPPVAAAPEVNAPPPGPARIAAKGTPSVEKCIEKSIHTPDYDRLHPRDSLRKLRRLQVKAECEEQLASR
jgi:hypothetical protein